MKSSATTTGVNIFVKTNECYWFLGVIDSYQTAQFKAEVPFQVWKFKKNKTGNGCVVTCEDGDKNVVIRQRIPFTDCPQEEFTFWCIDETIMLPSEY